jgi:hypothetical protein
MDISVSSEIIGGNLPREYAALYSQVFPDRMHRLQGCFPVHRAFLLSIVQLGAQKSRHYHRPTSCIGHKLE